MASAILPDVGNIFPEGTTVAAHTRDQWGANVVDGAPRGVATDTSPVSGGELQFSSLQDGVQYVAYAVVGGVKRFVQFAIDVQVLTGPPGLDFYPTRDVAIDPGFAVTVPAVSTQIAPEDDDRLWCDIYNEDLSETVYLGLGQPAVVGQGIPVPPGRNYKVENFTGAIFGITDGVSALLSCASL